jgi:site-specific DNA-methyltransferase (adenine-specific)
MKSWGFKYKTVLFAWIKLNLKVGTIVCGPGSYTRSACEYVLLGMRGHIKRISTKPVSQILMAPRTGHSKKPPIIRNYIVSLFGDLPRLELFAREQADGWDAMGLDINGYNIKDSITKVLFSE